MESDEKTMHSLAGAAAGTGERDFVSVDDGGDFTYHPSAAALLRDYEYIGEAICIVDRAGNAYRLRLDENHQLYLGSSLGVVDFSWLRQAALRAEHRNLREHPLRRYYPASKEALLNGLFETLYLEHSPDPMPWSLTVDGTELHPATLRDIDRRLAGRDHLEGAMVRDPFGHVYRAVRVPTHRRLVPAGSICYVEVQPRNAGQG